MASIAGQIASGGVQFGLSRLFGGGGGGSFGIPGVTTHTPAFRLHSGFTSGGELSTALTRLQTPEFLRRVQRQGRVFEDLDTIRESIRPGFGQLSDAVVQSVGAARDRAIGNLRQQLADRRVSGASFALDAEARTRKEFAIAENRARAEAIIGEIALTSQVLDQESGLLQQEIQNELAELGIASGQTNAFLNAVSQANNIDKQLAAQEARGAGQFFGPIVEDIGQAVNKGVSGFFSGGSSGQSVLERLISQRVGAT